MTGQQAFSRNTADALKPAVVHLRLACAGESNLQRRLCDLQRAVHNHEFHVREVLVRVLEVARRDADRVLAHVRALRRPGLGRGFLHARVHVVQLVVRRHGLVARNGMLVAVVGDGGAVLRHGDNDLVGNRRDGQRAVHNHEFHVREVLVRVLEVARRDADRVLAHVRALRRPGLGRGFLHARVHVVQLVVRRHGLVARNGMLVAVVGDGGAVLRHGDNDLVGNRRDGQLARLLLNNVVLRHVRAGRVHNLHFAGEYAFVFVHIRAGRKVAQPAKAMPRHKADILDAFDALQCAVIRQGLAFALEFNRSRRDPHHVVDHQERHIEVFVRIPEIFRQNIERIYADVRSPGRPIRHIRRNVPAKFRNIHRIGRSNRLNARAGLLRAVIGVLRAVFRNRDGYGALLHLDVAVCEHGNGHGVVFAGDDEEILVQPHRRLACVRPGGLRRLAVGKGNLHAVIRRLIGKRPAKAFRRMLVAVIYRRRIVAGNRGGDRLSGNGQLAGNDACNDIPLAAVHRAHSAV